MKRKIPPPPPANPLEDSLARFQPLLDPAEFSALLEELKHPLLPAVRINPLKIDPQAAMQDWQARYNWQVQPVPFCETGWQIISSPAPISQTIEHKLGFYYIQDAASMLPVELFDFEGVSAPLVLDLAASPGGKTTHLAARIADRGLVIANDASFSRLTALRLILNTWGAVNSAITHFPGEVLGAWLPDTFDCALLDAPCSMEGLRTSESHPMRPISAGERQKLSERQARLLQAAFQAVKPGGQVVYSTCTLAPEEDEAVLESLLNKYSSAVQIVDLQAHLPKPAPALSSSNDSHFQPAIKGAARLWPHTFGTAGFFAALIRKVDSVPVPELSSPHHPFTKSGLAPVRSKKVKEIESEWLQNYGFDLRSVLDDQNLLLYQRQETIYAVPELYIRLFSHLPCQSIGLSVAVETPNGIEPTHYWVTRYHSLFKNRRFTLPQGFVPAWLRGEFISGSHHPYEINASLRDGGPADFLNFSDPAGTLVIVADTNGRLLGRGRILQERLKNLLPRQIV